MNEPILKTNWERFKAHVDLDISTATTLLSPYTKDPINQLCLLSEGCANTNYKVTFKNNSVPVVIRIYMRDQSALQRETALSQLVTDKLPVPTYLYTNDQCSYYPYSYAIIEWIDGKLMRDVIFEKNEIAIGECAFEAGQYSNTLRQINFKHGGFFQENLQIRPFNNEDKYLPFVLNLLQDNIIKESLGEP